VAIINLCSLLAEMLQLRQYVEGDDALGNAANVQMFRMFCVLDEECQFEEVLVCLLNLFDKLWVGMEAGYMDFPHVLTELKTRITTVLARKPLDSNHLYAFCCVFWIRLCFCSS
jgi:hypothetical protein